MASGDNSHRQFLNTINDENTVANSSGAKFQVDDGYTKYYMNKNDHSWVGGDVRLDDQGLIGMGLNPSDYEEVKIVR